MGASNNQFQGYLKNPNEYSFFLKETTPDEATTLLQKITQKRLMAHMIQVLK